MDKWLRRETYKITPRTLTWYPDEWLTTARRSAGGKARQLEGDDTFSFRWAGFYMTQAFLARNTGLRCKVKVKVTNRKVGVMITEDKFMKEGWTHRVSEKQKAKNWGQRQNCPRDLEKERSIPTSCSWVNPVLLLGVKWGQTGTHLFSGAEALTSSFT